MIYIITQLAVHTTYIPLIVLAFWGGYICYMIPTVPPFTGNQKQPLIRCWQPKNPKLPMSQSIEPSIPSSTGRHLRCKKSSWKHFFCSAGKHQNNTTMLSTQWCVDTFCFEICWLRNHLWGQKFRQKMWMGCFCFQQNYDAGTLSYIDFRRLFWRGKKKRGFFSS